MRWLGVVAFVAFVAVCVGGCAAADSGLELPDPVQSSASPTSVAGPGPGESSATIRPDEVSVLPDAPDWCDRLLTPSVRSLPAALDVLGDEDSTAVLELAAEDLSAIPSDSVPVEVHEAFESLVPILRALAQSSEPDPERLQELGSAFEVLAEATNACGFQ